ncbi:MAG TPA: hypothetical protein VK425_07925, partial [Acidimicrobiales bacterium]|nr:hypothetical protein [Acidimicrobiales bacterium]
EDSALPVLRARRPARLGGGEQGATIWALGPLSRAPWPAARLRLEQVAAVRSQWLPDWLEAGVGEWGQRPVVWLSAATPVSGTLASPGPDMAPPARLRAVAAAARGANDLHERGLLHAAICPQAVALVAAAREPASPRSPLGEDVSAVLAPPALADGAQPLLQVGYPPIGFVDPQLLRGEAGRWSDVWALGATAQYALTGSSPYPGIEELPVVRALVQLLAVPPPTPASAELPGPLSELVTSCLAPDPEARPGSAQEVAERLEEIAAKW